ncbi:hypothetical protein B0H14DRAFT_3504376 [Mycena olivaceomarginata]|nr:hypothetical protein B0H14DRAFT_3504376 [Mycena olivaceomarginata]
MSTLSRPTHPTDAQLVLYRQGNGTETALTAAYVSAGDIIAERVASRTVGVHEFVYRILQPGYPRYYPVYRFGSIGEVYKVTLSEQGAVVSFSIRSPSAGTPNAIHHHLETVSVLFYLLEEDKHRRSQEFTVASTWIDASEEDTEDRYIVHCTSYTELLGEVVEGAVVVLEATLHRYHHFTSDDTEREYNLVGHRVEVVEDPYLLQVGFVYTPEEADKRRSDTLTEPRHSASRVSSSEDASEVAEDFARLDLA